MRTSRLLAVIPLWVCALCGQSFPLSQNNWSNPEFVDRFLGSYGVLTDREPKITTEESEVLQQLPSFLSRNDYVGAINFLSTKMGGLSEDPSAAMDYTLGNLYLQSNNYAGGIQAYKQALRKFPNFLRAYKNLGLAYLQTGDFENARTMLVKALELGDSDGDTFGLVGYCYLNDGMIAKARDAYAIARVLRPGNRDWVIGYGQALLQTQQYDQAIAVFEELISEQPDRDIYYTQIANAYIAKQDYDSAARYLEIIRRMGKAKAATLGLLGDIYVNKGLFDLALKSYLESYEAEGTVTIERGLRIAKAFISRAAYPQAEEILTMLEGKVQKDENEKEFANLLNLKAELAFAQGREDEAIAALEEVTRLDPFNGEALLLLGVHYRDSAEDLARAGYYFDLAQNVPAVAADAYVEHARMKVTMKDYTQAVDLLEKAQGIDYRAPVARYIDAVKRVMDAAR